MKKVALLFFLLIASAGCLDEKLSPEEARECLLSTNTQPSTIPACDSARECEKALNEKYSNNAFQMIEVGRENISARKGMSAAWHRLNTAAKSSNKIHEACSDAEIKTILAHAVTTAGELQGAIKGSEDAQLNTYTALEKSIQYGSQLSLEEVKDTDAFHAYAGLVQRASEIGTGNPVSEWGVKQAQNKEYFDNIGRVIAHNKENPYEITWKSVFDAYKTGVIMHAGQKARGIIALSPLWQGALSAVLGRSKSVNILSIVNEISANEVITHTEEVVSPTNGLLLPVWEEIVEFEQKIIQLMEDEKKMEKDAQEKIIKLKEKELHQKNTNEKWEKIAREIWAWNRIVFGTTTEDKYDSLPEETSRIIESERESLSLERTLNTKPIGKRIAEWRKLSKKIEDIHQKIILQEEMNEKRLQTCQKIVEKIVPSENRLITSAEDCQLELKKMSEEAISQKDTQLKVEAAHFDSCLTELNEWENALGEETTKPDYFEYYFGEKSSSDCESALANAKGRYETNPTVVEGERLRAQINKMREILQKMLNYYPEEKKNGITVIVKSAEEDAAIVYGMTIQEWKKKKVEWEKRIVALEKTIDDALSIAAQQIRWKITSPARVIVGETQDVTWEGTIVPATGQEMEHAFIVSTPNPGISKIDYSPENTRTTIGEDEILVEGDTIPSNGILIRGSGTQNVATITIQKTTAKVFGRDAIIEEKFEIQTKFFPLEAVLKKSSVSNGNLPKIEGANIFSDEKENVNMTLNEAVTEILVTRSEKDVVLVQTDFQKTETKWGKEYTTIQVTATNRLGEGIEATIYTGVYGDPSTTTAIRISNENGESVPVKLDATGNIILQNQQLDGGQERKYVIQIERWEGSEEWASIMERMISETARAQQYPNATLAREADKIMTTLTSLRSTPNTSEIGQKLTLIQNQVSLLNEKIRIDIQEWENIEKKWIQAKSNAPASAEKWVEQGNTALQSHNRQKVEEAIEKIIEEKQKYSPIKIETNTFSNEKISLAKELVSATEKEMEEYEKSISVGCEKLALINYICPLGEKQFSEYKKSINDFQKLVSKIEVKINKLSSEQLAQEWKLVENEWSEKEIVATEIKQKVEGGKRMIRNAAIERVEKIKQEIKNTAEEEVREAVEKAARSIDDGEYGKSIFIAQNMLNYVSGNKMGGLFALIPAAGPFLGIVFVVGVWLAWKEWKKKKIPEIKKVEIPKGKTVTRGENDLLNENGHPTTPEEYLPLRRAEAWTESQERGKQFGEIEEKILHEEPKISNPRKRK